MNEVFSIGDVVILKSGGPHMTVTGLGGGMMSGPDDVTVSWFDAKHEVKHASFNRNTLDKAD